MTRQQLQHGMSFTAEVVAELAPHVPILSCCRAALIEGMQLAGPPVPQPSGTVLTTSRAAAARLALAALHASHVQARLERRQTARRVTYALVWGGTPLEVSPGARTCCDRSRLRGAFLESGAVSRPDSPPHLEMAARSDAAAATLVQTLERLGISSALSIRRGRTVVLVRSVEGIGALLSSIGAQSGRLRFEEGRVVREVRATVNRRINAETANLRRIVDSGLRQARAAAALQRDEERWRRLPPGVREAALLRHRHPQDTLDRLASRAGTSRSAMAGRLRRLMEIAEC